MKRKKRSLCHIMCGSRHKSRGSWHVQQQQRFRLKKENLCGDTHVIVGFIMETRGHEQSWELLRVQTTLSHDWNYKILKIEIFSCLILNVRKFHSLSGQSALPLVIRMISSQRSEVGLIQTPYFILIPVPLWVIY